MVELSPPWMQKDSIAYRDWDWALGHKLITNRKVGFMLIPKVGSTTMFDLLTDNGFERRRVNNAKDPDRDILTTNIIYSIIREPHSRLVSAFVNHYRNYDELSQCEFIDTVKHAVSRIFDNNDAIAAKAYNLYFDEHFLPQEWYLGLFPVDRYILLDELSECISEYLIPKYNLTPPETYHANRRSVPYADMTQAVEQILQPYKSQIEKIYSRDFRLHRMVISERITNGGKPWNIGRWD